MRMDRQDDEHAFMRKKLRYGVDYRGAAAYRPVAAGLCQQGNAERHQLRRGPGRHDVGEERRRPAPGDQAQLLLVPPSLEAEAREILQAQFIIGDPTTGGAKHQYLAGHG